MVIDAKTAKRNSLPDIQYDYFCGYSCVRVQSRNSQNKVNGCSMNKNIAVYAFSDNREVSISNVYGYVYVKRLDLCETLQPDRFS